MLHFSVNRRMGGLAAILAVGIVFTVVGGIFAAIGFDTYRDGKETESWIATTGQISESRVDTETKTVRRKNRYTTETVYTPVVAYSYSVNGTAYTNDHIRADDHGTGQSAANDLVGQFPDGSTTTVYYNPTHPNDAVLIRGAESSQVYLFGGLGGLFGLFGLGLTGGMGVVLRRLHRGSL